MPDQPVIILDSTICYGCHHPHSEHKYRGGYGMMPCEAKDGRKYCLCLNFKRTRMS